SIALSISEIGMPVQWSADVTEHAHIEVIKEPASTMNHHNYDAQICCYLDHVERCWLFETVTHLSTLRPHDANNTHDHDTLDSAIEDDEAGNGETDMEDDEDATAILKDIWSPRCSVPDFFALTKRLKATLPGSIPCPVHMFSLGNTALCINHNPSIKCISIGEAAKLFDIPDL
ncbi:hypothetical protein PISMIDRAFT_97436, partial [Pisolithus microcarpus 441]